MTAEVDAPNRHPSVDRMLPDCGQDGVTVDRTTRDTPTYERPHGAQLETARGFIRVVSEPLPAHSVAEQPSSGSVTPGLHRLA
ncbi:MAG: hypothetical protein ACRDPA_00865, partial [Solirubrobacteraceae bacterium]